MKFFSTVVAALAVLPSVLAVDEVKSAIISWNDDAPQSAIDKVKDDILRAGGQITHEYTIIRGISVKAPASILETVQTQDTGYGMKIEEDQTATVN